MIGTLVQDNVKSAQKFIYEKLNKFSKSNTGLGRLGSIPVSIVDVALDTFGTPVSAIEHLGMIFINLVGALFSKDYSLKHALVSMRFTLGCIVGTPVDFALAPINIIFQFFAIIIDPEKVQSINFSNNTFKN
jgi:hypothetical protein